MTIQEVADKAGVSTATVSRMINKNGFVSDEAKERIRQAMKETGYDPAQRKRRVQKNVLSPLKHRNVALLWTTGKEAQLSTTGQELLHGITAGLRQINTSLTVDHIDSSGHIPRVLLTGAIDGVFIHGHAPTDVASEYLKKFPVVWLLQQGSFDFGDRIQPDHTAAGEISCDYLIRQGCQNLCTMSYTSTYMHSKFWETRADGFINYALQNKIPCSLIDHPAPTAPETRQSEMAAIATKLVNSFCQLHPQPDGLFVANDLGVYIHGELTKRGIIPMKDVILVAGDANVCVQHMDPEPVKIRIFSQKIGHQAVEILILRIKNPDMPQITCLLKPQLIIPE